MSPLPSSGELKFSDIAVEFGGSNNEVSLGDYRSRGGTVPAAGIITFPDNFYSANGNNYSFKWQTRLTPTAGNQTVTIPDGVYRVKIVGWGAGGGGSGNVNGGGGGHGSAVFRVVPGEILKFYVGGGGSSASNIDPGAGGGGYTGVFIGSTPLIVVGAGAGAGGDGNNGNGGYGGAGGGLVGQDGGNAPGQGGGEGRGGTQTAGGTCVNQDGDEADGGPGSQYNGGDAAWSDGYAGGLNGGGNGGAPQGGGGGGGGGGSGYFGGAGGEKGDSSGSDEYGGGGGGGGSTFINKTATTPLGVVRYYDEEVNVGGNLIEPGGTDRTDYTGTVGRGGTSTRSGSNGLLVIRI